MDRDFHFRPLSAADLAHEGQLGMGLGSAMVSAFVDLQFQDPAVSKVQTDPSPDNLRAIRSWTISSAGPSD